MKQENSLININIDNKTIKIKKGTSILHAAEQHDIYIPTLCAHKNLSPYGGCRLCLVEVEGARGFLTACTTPVEDGMVIRTYTDQLQKERREIMELILSEHTSSCLICEEKESCRISMTTIRKVGVTTGCRYCPNDDKCELEKVVSWLGIKEINYPISYRGFRVEKDDPFYDRDYNLCIYCGRCIRICQEERLANVLAFTQRGRNTVIGPAFGRSHLEAGCEFCGACVEVCPTGALAEKVNKWDGVAENQVTTTCALCGVGCQLNVLTKGDRLIGTVPAEDELVNQGHLCVKGRFSVYELINNFQRLKKAQKYQDGIQLQISLDEAVQIAAERLTGCPPDEFGMILSPNCTTEDFYIAQKFTRLVMNSHHIDTSARLFYGAAFNAYLDLMKNSTSLENIKNSSLIFAIGLDLRYGRSVVGVELRRACSRGTKIITLHPNEHSLALCAEVWLQTVPGEEADILAGIWQILETGAGKKSNPEQIKIAELLTTAKQPIFLIGTEFLNYSNNVEILELVNKIAQKIGAGILPLPAQNNLYGSLLMGAYPELLPGARQASDQKNLTYLSKLWGRQLPLFKENWNLNKTVAGKKLKLAYLVGEVPPTSEKFSEYLIYQNIFPLTHSQQANLSFPAAAFTEIDGTFINGEGRIQPLQKAVPAPGDALPDWQIICKIAQKMGAAGFDFQTVADIHAELGKLVEAFSKSGEFSRQAQPLPATIVTTPPNIIKSAHRASRQNDPFILTISNVEHTYRGIPLSSKVAGLRKLFNENFAIINTLDAATLNLNNGDNIKISSDQLTVLFPIWISNEQQPGTVHVTSTNFQLPTLNPQFVKLEKEDV